MNIYSRLKGRSEGHGRSIAAGTAFMIGVMAALSSMPATSEVVIAQSPLFLGSEVPGNLVLTPSVEWPTINSVANLGSYDVAREYVGYFDANKCYQYSYDVDEAKRHFYPVSTASSRACNAAPAHWSGNYLNWAATQTIDPFRLALTGGNRVLDTATETWLQKARHDGQGNVFPNRTTSGAALVSGATPATGAWTEMRTRVAGLGHKMYFMRDGINRDGLPTLNEPGTPVAYDPAVHGLSGIKLLQDGVTEADDSDIYEVSVRVRVCKEGLLERNCKNYGASAKPEGLIQEYSNRIRYSVFGYLNDHSMLRDGAVLRANQAFVGPNSYMPGKGPVVNTRSEWDPATGVIYSNPDRAAATATNTDLAITTNPIELSGVINYLNKFGEMTGKNHKSHDPVSEMYYAALRYLRNVGGVNAYSLISERGPLARELADGFPVVTAWEDPILFRCQANVILGIGDVNTHRDKNLPGSTNATEEPAKPAEVTADKSVDVIAALNKIAQLEGISINTGQSFSGRNNSAFIAALAYDAHTRDMRPEMRGMQTVSTHWVDVREGQILEKRDRNQYWLAAKYGGFRVPQSYVPYSRTEALPQSWWHDSGDVLSNGDLRPDNFYVASEADKMVASLTRAFARIASEMGGSGATFGANSNKLEEGSTLYQARYYSGSWRGELTAYALDPRSGAILGSSWQASAKVPNWDQRKIFSASSGQLREFSWQNLSSAQQAALGSEKVVDYLRGDRSGETADGGLRIREGVLGDFINSQPVYAAPADPGLYKDATFTGAGSYGAFATEHAKMQPVVYIGGNDGMLHGFNAKTGVETFAYVPRGVIGPQLKSYSDPNYEHRYFVDGEITIASAYIGNEWKQVLVGTLGRGGRGIFALDISDPDNVELLWDLTAADVPALGNNLGQPIIAQVKNNVWKVILGSGPNNNSGSAELLVIDLFSGVAKAKKVADGPNNGLSATLVWSTATSEFFDAAYAGDLSGNLWKFGNLDGNPTAAKVFAGVSTKPITAAPLGAVQPGTNKTWLFFGTGRYLNDADLSATQTQTWYGVVDGNEVSESSLIKRSIVADISASGSGYGARVISEGTALSGTARGWYIDLTAGERMVVPNQFQGLVLRGTTIIPDNKDPCNPAGVSYDMAINPFTGGRLSGGFFDVNGDGVVDDMDKVEVNGVKVPASGVSIEGGANRPLAVGGNSYLTTLSGGQVKHPQGQATVIRRVSWREIVGD